LGHACIIGSLSSVASICSISALRFMPETIPAAAPSLAPPPPQKAVRRLWSVPSGVMVASQWTAACEPLAFQYITESPLPLTLVSSRPNTPSLPGSTGAERSD